MSKYQNLKEYITNRQIAKKILLPVIEELSLREQEILELRFGLNSGISHTLEEVGREFDVTRERIRQMEAKALEKIQRKLKQKGIKNQ